MTNLSRVVNEWPYSQPSSARGVKRGNGVGKAFTGSMIGREVVLLALLETWGGLVQLLGSLGIHFVYT